MISRNKPRITRGVMPLLAAALAIGFLSMAGCQMSSDVPGNPTARPTRPIEDVQRDHTTELMAMPGVVGVYQGALEDGTPYIGVMVKAKTPELSRRIPRQLEGYPVRIDVTGPIRPMSPGGK